MESSMDQESRAREVAALKKSPAPPPGTLLHPDPAEDEGDNIGHSRSSGLTAWGGDTARPRALGMDDLLHGGWAPPYLLPTDRGGRGP